MYKRLSSIDKQLDDRAEMHTKYTNRQTLGRDKHTHRHTHTHIYMQPCTHANTHVCIPRFLCRVNFRYKHQHLIRNKQLSYQMEKRLSQDTKEGYKPVILLHLRLAL